MNLERILIYTETNNLKINPVYYELLTKAKQINETRPVKISCILLGSNLSAPLDELKQSGIDEVIVLDDERLKIYHIDYYCAAVAQAIQAFDPDIMLFGATVIGEELAPTIGVKFKTGVAAHCMDVRINPDGEFSQLVPAFGGKVIGEIFTPLTRPKVASIKPGILSSVPFKANPDCRVYPLDKSILDHADTSIDVVSFEIEPLQGINIEKAKFIACAGYGVAHSGISEDLQKLAQLLNGSVGFTRPAIDAGMSHNENNMIGTSGKSVKPKVYLGIGVSGSMHHACGMKDSDIIISINTDSNSELFSMSDYKVIGDGPTIIHELVKLISEQNPCRSIGSSDSF